MLAKEHHRGPGRPKGSRNKVTADIKALAQKSGPKVIKELLRLATKATNEGTRVAAAKELLDRGYGRAQTGIDMKLEGGVTLVDLLTSLAAVPAVEADAANSGDEAGDDDTVH